MIKSPLRYPGGKSRAVAIIAPMIPNFEEFREPFLGGGSIFVYIKQLFPQKRYWINDLYPNLFYFWKYLQKNSNELIKQIFIWKEEFKLGKELYKFLTNNIENFNEEKKAAAFFIFNRITFSGTSESGGFSNSAYRNRITLSSISRAKKLSSILGNTKITNYDYQRVVEEDGDNVFLFLDPPYYSTTKSALYGKNGDLHKNFDHKRFAEILKRIKHRWLMTYDDSQYIRKLFSFANIKTWNLTYGMKNVNSNNNKGKELLISNYDLFENNLFKENKNQESCKIDEKFLPDKVNLGELS